MKKITAIIIIAISLLYTGGVIAQTKQELSLLFRKFKSNNMLAYKSKTIATFPSGEVDTLTNEVCVNRDAMSFCYSNKLESVFMGEGWIYKADHLDRQVHLFNIGRFNAAYQEHPFSIEEAFNMSEYESVMDSVVIAIGNIVEYAKEGDVSYYKIAFPENYYIKSYEIRYNDFLNIPVNMKVEYEDNPFVGFFLLANTRMKLEYYDYQPHFDSRLLSVSEYVDVSAGKPVTKKYQNYKFNNIY